MPFVRTRTLWNADLWTMIFTWIAIAGMCVFLANVVAAEL
ncbi:MAG: hypothetical protein Greene041619_261 [Candidatus Peregrinibacteria bacterium Greene0416_19]|nr:MAG: hypothetical protein Greene041619_261 [Candidatus Peregrinibacteria bacterium Greene0416_19]